MFHCNRKKRVFLIRHAPFVNLITAFNNGDMHSQLFIPKNIGSPNQITIEIIRENLLKLMSAIDYIKNK